MDLGCLDLGCIEKQISKGSLDSDPNPNESLPTTSKIGKNKASKEASQSSISALNKFTTQIKKPPHRKTSPLNWFPRKKVDSYLKRKIKSIQEVGGMNLTLDETLGDSNPHYSKVLREKIAVREAAQRAMEARKAALVETSWCQILQAARIESKEAETLLLKAEKSANEAFEAAKAIGVIMYDIPDCPRKHYEIETSAVNGGESTTHTVTTSFETAFEVDKQVAAAVKAAFIRLANCASINKDEFKELLRKISQNPDLDENNLSELSSECESDVGSDHESESHKDGFITEFTETKQRQVCEKFNMTKLVDMMLQRLRCLQEGELASLATIVATCGLNAALAEAENCTLGSSVNNVPKSMPSFGERITRKHAEAEIPSLDKFLVKHLTRLEREVQDAKNARQNNEEAKACTVKSIVPSETTTGLGSILVKHYSKLEKEIEEAKKTSGEMFEKDQNSTKVVSSFETVPDFGSMLTKHTSKLEKEIEETKRNCGKMYESKGKKPGRAPNLAVTKMKQDIMEVPSLDKFLVKHVSRLEREVQEAKKKRNANLVKNSEKSDLSYNQLGKENVDKNKKDLEIEMPEKEINPILPTDKAILEGTEAMSLQVENKDSKEAENGLDKILVKRVHRLEREKVESLSSGSDFKILQHKNKYGGGSTTTNSESLDKILIKHVSRLEKEKMAVGAKEEVMKVVKRRDRNSQLEQNEGSLDQILVKHKSRLEREKVEAAQQPDNEIKHPSVAQKEARERELQEAWGGLSFGNSMRPHLSRLQRDKAAWLKAEEEERRAMKEEVV